MAKKEQASRPRTTADPSTPKSTKRKQTSTPTEQNTNRLTLSQALAHFRTPLHPLVSTTTGLPHPDFPSTLLSYHVLTSDQLDSLAVHFHQVWPPVPGTAWYPNTITPWIGTPHRKRVGLATKRRRFGHFIGLKGGEAPAQGDFGDRGPQKKEARETEDELMHRLDMEWMEGLVRARREDGDAALARKYGGGGY